MSHPCANGLRFERPKRLFGFDGTAGEDPCSPTGLMSLRAIGLSPATAGAILDHPTAIKLQGSGRGLRVSESLAIKHAKRRPAQPVGAPAGANRRPERREASGPSFGKPDNSRLAERALQRGAALLVFHPNLPESRQVFQRREVCDPCFPEL